MWDKHQKYINKFISFLLTIATVALKALLVSLYTRFRPNVGWFPGSLPMYSAHNTLLSGGGDNDSLLTGCNKTIKNSNT